MGSRRVGFSVVTLVIWFWVLMPGGGSASRQRVEGWVPCTRDSQETDKDMVQQIWMNCWLDSSVIKLNENSPEEDLVSDSTKVNQGRRLLTIDEMQKAIDLLPLQMQHSLLDCLGSSQKSFGCADSINKEKTGTLSFKTEPSQNEQVSSLDINSARTAPSGEISGISSSSIDPSISPFIAPAPKPPSPPPLMPPPIKKVARPPPGPPPPPPNLKPGPCPPLPPKVTFPPRPPQTSSSSGRVPSPLGLNHSRNRKLGADDNNAPKIKLKPFFWDKVLATPDHSMVWHEISSGSFQFNEEMIESLFGYSTDKQKNVDKKDFQYIQILDPKKSQNLAIQLRALNVTREEVCDALMEGNELPTELLQTLLKMAPTTDEELKLRLYAGDLSQLGPGEQFLKTLVDIPFAFKRLDALLFMSSLQEDVSTIKESFATFEIACQELRSSRLFLKLLEAVLKTGNRMNDGTYRGGAQAFKLDTLLKLADVKGTDGKTTLLLFVVQEIMRSEGVRAARAVKESRSISSLTVTSAKSEDTIDDSPCEYGDHYRNLGLKAVSGLGDELENVKKAAVLDDNALTNMVGNLGKGLVKTKEFLNKDMMSMEEDSGFHHSLKGFIENVEVDITSLLEEEKRIRSLVKSTSDYFHGNAGKDEGLRLFVIVRDFLVMLDNACKEVRVLTKRAPKMLTNKEEPAIPPVPVPRQWLFPAVKERWVDNSSSDDGSP